MQLSSFSEVVNTILSKDARYRAEAYFFLRDVLHLAFKRRKKAYKEKASLHVSHKELLNEFRIHVLKEFGPMGMAVLEFWGVKKAADIGNMIFHLIEMGVLAKTEQDQLESFAKGLDFQEAFVRPFQPTSTNVLLVDKLKAKA